MPGLRVSYGCHPSQVEARVEVEPKDTDEDSEEGRIRRLAMVRGGLSSREDVYRCV